MVKQSGLVEKPLSSNKDESPPINTHMNVTTTLDEQKYDNNEDSWVAEGAVAANIHWRKSNCETCQATYTCMNMIGCY